MNNPLHNTALTFSRVEAAIGETHREPGSPLESVTLLLIAMVAEWRRHLICYKCRGVKSRIIGRVRKRLIK